MAEVRVEPYQFALVILVTEVNLARVPKAPRGQGSGVGVSSLEGGAGKEAVVASKGVDRGAPRQRAPLSIPETPHLELLGGQECRARTTSPRSFSTPLIPYPCPVIVNRA
jgi:hypothetical protein